MAGESSEVVVADLAESTARGKCSEAASCTEKVLAEVLAGLVHAERVPVDSDFFEDLGADSLMMAHFCARVRKRSDVPSVSMKDIYRNPTIRSLAAALAVTTPAPEEPAAAVSIEAPAAVSTLRYTLCGALQLLLFLAYSYLVALLTEQGYGWISSGSSLVDVYLRSVLFSGAGFSGLCILPILAKWILIGRWKPRRVRVWSLGYVRFWVVKTLVMSNPLVLFAGSPIYILYLRALGAKVGRGVTIFSRNVPVCSDLLTIGDGTVICKDSFLLCYRARAGWIETGTVALGRDVFIGEKTVLDIETAMGDGAQLGHASSLHAGQVVPDGERWHGSPAQRTEVDYLRVAPANCGTLRRASFAMLTVLETFFLFLPLVEGTCSVLLGAMPAPNTSLEFYIDALVLSLALFSGLVLVGLLFVATVPRLLSLFIKPNKVYPLYGFHYRAHRMIARLTNIKFFTYLFGDSSYIVHFLRYLGYDLSQVEQTGSNFGLEVRHESPYLCFIGSGTMVADGLSIINADFSSTSFRVSQTSIGTRNFLGNDIVYPAQGRTGDNCLLATKVMVPLDGKIREGVGLLGSPCFEIPRSVERDSRFDDLRTGEELRRRLAAKNRHNIRSMAIFLFVRWLHVLLIVALGLVAVDSYGKFAQIMVAASFAMSILVSPVYFALVERAMTAFRPLRPKFCSIYDPYFWWHERLWKLPVMTYLQVFNGTPFKNLIWRLLGVRLGSRIFDDGCFLTERTLVTIGNDCTLNAGSKIQCHSQEDGTFKSDRTTIGAGCTVGVGALVHYGVTMGGGATLDPDSFLMKGEEIPSYTRWGGNPARTGMQPWPTTTSSTGTKPE